MSDGGKVTAAAETTTRGGQWRRRRGGSKWREKLGFGPQMGFLRVKDGFVCLVNDEPEPLISSDPRVEKEGCAGKSEDSPRLLKLLEQSIQTLRKVSYMLSRSAAAPPPAPPAPPGYPATPLPNATVPRATEPPRLRHPTPLDLLSSPR
ncbi:hypothetical protein Droror1_Dr00000689 [Drosera rotundifolia]